MYACSPTYITAATNYKSADLKFSISNVFIINEANGFTQVGLEKWFFPKEFEGAAKTLYNFEVRSNDVWTVGFPRSGKVNLLLTCFCNVKLTLTGTTLTQEMVWLIANDMDFETAASIPLEARFPFIE